jgi:hypothetical protein
MSPPLQKRTRADVSSRSRWTHGRWRYHGLTNRRPQCRIAVDSLRRGIATSSLETAVHRVRFVSSPDITPHTTKGRSMPKKSREQKRAEKTRARAKKRHQRQAARPFAPGGLPFGDTPEAPPGFRPLPMMQAMLEFAAPLMDYVEQGTVQDPNEALQIAMQLWNSTLPNVPPAQRPSRSAMLHAIQTTLQMSQQDAEAFCERMIARKAYLFPEEIQPAGSMTMFMRKEVEYLITPFAESQLHLSDAPIPPDRDDATVLEALRQLEARIAAGEDYGDWEADFFAMQEQCCQRYQQWLRAKGVSETLSQQFAFCLDPYLTFLFQYDGGNVQDVVPDALEEFFMDWLLRKVMVQPPEYTQWPPTLRLFYRFLADKGYLADPEPIVATVQALEPDFIALVQQRS